MKEPIKLIDLWLENQVYVRNMEAKIDLFPIEAS